MLATSSMLVDPNTRTEITAATKNVLHLTRHVYFGEEKGDLVSSFVTAT